MRTAKAVNATFATCDWPGCTLEWTHYHEREGEALACYCDDHAEMAAHGFVPHTETGPPT